MNKDETTGATATADDYDQVENPDEIDVNENDSKILEVNDFVDDE